MGIERKKILPIRKELINVYDVVYDTILSLSLLAQDKDIEIINHMKEGDVVYADRNTLMNILRNILDNAIKFTPEKGQITFLFEAIKDASLIIIEDTGIGISQIKMNEIQSLGMNASVEGTKGEKGTGLGLYLVHELMNSNQGEIEIVSEVNKGTTFKLYFPKKSN